MPIWTPLLAALLLTVAAATTAADEARWTTQLTQTVPASEQVRLETGAGPFLALYRDHTTVRRHGSALLLHGTGAHADWPEVIGPLRRELPDHGWTTLSVQLPAGQPGQVEPAFERIAAAIRHLRSQDPAAPLVIIGHGRGASLAAAYLASQTTQPQPANGGAGGAVQALVAIGIGAGPDTALDPAAAMAHLRMPVLDLHGSLDRPEVLGGRQDRAAAARRSGNTGFLQVQIPGADHTFSNMCPILVKRVRGWLARHVAAPDAMARF